MEIRDPRAVNEPWYTRFVAPYLNDRRDALLIGFMAQCLCIVAAGVAIFAWNPPLFWVAPIYGLAMFVQLGRFTLMLHCTSHRQLFTNQHAWLNQLIPWLLGPFFGQTPGTYFAHHMGMHHPEENLESDLSSTMRFQRDRFDHWLRYWLRFLFVGLIELVDYHRRRGKKKLVQRVLIGELSFWSTVAVLGFARPGATLLVFVAPLLLIRMLMMMGNWAQHSFVCAEQPENPFRASITCINTPYNRRCFNDGYHVLHHIQPRCHWSEHPIEFENKLADYGRHDSIVFDGLDFFQVWLCLMLGRWSVLAAHFVQLPGAPLRSPEQVTSFLRSRVLPVDPLRVAHAVEAASG